MALMVTIASMALMVISYGRYLLTIQLLKVSPEYRKSMIPMLLLSVHLVPLEIIVVII